MNRPRKTAVLLTFIAALGTIASEQPTLARQRRELVLLRGQHESLTKQIARLTRLPPEPDSPVGAEFNGRSKSGSDESDSVSNARELRKFFEDNPDLSIPELTLLSDLDWLELARTFRSREVRLSAERVRFKAKDLFALALWQALERYQRSNQGQLPESLHELAPSFAPPVDPAILNRYEILHDQPALELARVPWVIAERSVVDEDYGHRLYLPATGAWRNEEPPHTLNAIIREATFEFVKANQRKPTTPEEIAPYVREDRKKYYDLPGLQRFWPSPRRIDPFKTTSSRAVITISESPDGRTKTSIVEPP